MVFERFECGLLPDRTKVMRAFDNEEGAGALAEGFRVHYNLVRKHQALRVTPGEAAGLAPMEGFKWLHILAQAAKETNPCPEA